MKFTVKWNDLVYGILAPPAGTDGAARAGVVKKANRGFQLTFRPPVAGSRRGYLRPSA